MKRLINKPTQRFLAILLTFILILPVSAFQANAYTVDYNLPENELYSLELNGPPTYTTGATFVNVDGGKNEISMTEARSFEVKVPVATAAGINAEDIQWTLSRTEAYLDEALYPYYKKGGDLAGWKDSSNRNPLFKNIVTTVEEDGDDVYIKLTFDSNPFYSDFSVPHGSATNTMDYIGWFSLAAVKGNETLGSVAVKNMPYDTFLTMGEVYEQMNAMEELSKEGLYVKKESMGKSTIGYDMPYLIIAKSEEAVNNWLALSERAETDPDTVLAELQAGTLTDYQVPIIYTNIHSNETSSTDAIMDFAWMLLENETINYDILTGFTEDGEARLAEQLGTAGVKGSIATSELINPNYLGFLSNSGQGTARSGVVDMDKFYTRTTNTVNRAELLDDVFYILVPEENVEGRIFMSRTATGGFDLNRDNSFQTQNETKFMQQMIGKYNPVSLTELHGRVTSFQCEPCNPPHEPNFEYDLLSRNLMTGGEVFGNVAVANNDMYNSYVIPMRDYLEYTGNGNETIWPDPWDDMSTSYTPQFAMLHGCASYTVEQPAYNDATVKACSYGQLGQSNYVAQNKKGYFEAQVETFSRGVKNFNSNAYELVGQWFADQKDIPGAEMDLFRPVYDGVGENGNFYPECYIIPLDRNNQKNLHAAYEMMEWLTRNDVKVLLSESSFTYDGVTYPVGTMVVPMHQAKRSVANGALYNGTLISSWTVLYSEGITAFNKTRGFDMVTCAKPAEASAIKAVCGQMMDNEDTLAYMATAAKSSVDGDRIGYQVIISNVSQNSSAAVNALLKADKTVGMITEGDNQGNFICSYEDWLTIKDEFILTVTCISTNYPSAKVIEKNPVLYINGKPGPRTTGYANYNLVTAAGWNYDRQSMDHMNFETTTDINEADVIIGNSAIDAAALPAVKAGKPYIAYGSSATSSARLNNFFDGISRNSVSRRSMDALAYVIYPEVNLINATYVAEGDDILYGYGAGFFNDVPVGAETLARIDSERLPLEGFLVSKDVDSASNLEEFLDGSIQAFSYKGKDKADNDINVAFFANSLTHKVHQRDEFNYIANFAFSNMLGKDYTAVEYVKTSKPSTPSTPTTPTTPVTPTVPEIPTDVETKETLAKLASDTFNDIKATDWFADSVGSMIKMNLMQGTSDTTFAPQSLFNRAMMVTVLHRFAGEPDVTNTSSFQDIASGTWFSNAVIWASANNLVNGYENGNYGPNDPVTREQVITVLYRYAASTGLNVTAADSIGGFNDKEQISNFASVAMNWAVSKGIVQGNTMGMLNPKATATRAEVAAMMIRAIELFK